jgi:membrane peptidoglycan carboxypeptidase
MQEPLKTESVQEPLKTERIVASDPQPSLLDAAIFPFREERVAAPRPVARARRRVLRFNKYGVLLLVALVLGAVLLLESHTSIVQALAFSHWSAQLKYGLEPGPAPAIAFPATGPFDERRGYTRLARFAQRLKRSGYRITQQARQSAELTRLIDRGIAPPFREPGVAELVIRDVRGRTLHQATGAAVPTWKSLDEIPPLVVQSLLFIENRSIGDGAGPLQNPAVDVGRSSKAFALYIGRTVGFNWPLEGGSTLATQLEKFRHSPSGHTASPAEKLRQIIGASLAAYHGGLNTRAQREQIILDYLNTMPLGAVPGAGEINGLGQGLQAWFGVQPAHVFAALRSASATAAKARAYREVLALLYSVHAPTYYLSRDHAALDARIDAYLGLLAAARLIDEPLLALIKGTHLNFATAAAATEPPRFIERKAANAVRTELGALLGVSNLYDLDRLNLQVDSTIDAGLTEQVSSVLGRLSSAQFVATNGLMEPHMLERGDPKGVTYSLLLVESRPEGNLVRVHTDTLDAPFDVNDGTKLELGSTAKLRTLVHYLELVAQLHDEFSPLGTGELAARAAAARDPITRWAAITLFAAPHLSLDKLLERALERHYSGSPEEEFFTGGGIHHFRNFEPEDDAQELSVREAVIHSTNLVFIRLMRDLVRFHEARLPYDSEAALEDEDGPVRRRLLQEIAAEEQRRTHTSFAWLLFTNHDVQDTRIRIRIERDAFERMTPYWRRLGFPFERLVPSYATAIGSSADRPAALAELMGIIVNEGRRRPTYDISRLGFASGTAYETVLKPAARRGEQVIRTPIAHLVRKVLGEVVESGTARRLKGAFRDAQGEVMAIGGKTGSGDNRYETFARDGHLIAAHPVSRTAVFVFYLGERWYGVITASVSGPQSGNYTFTSSLPLATLKLLAPAISVAARHEQAPQPLSAGAGEPRLAQGSPAPSTP